MSCADLANGTSRVRQNYLAIVIASVACFLFEAAWYQFFMDTWLNGIGQTREWLVGNGVSPALQFATALLAEGVMAAAISCVTQLTGPQTVLRGIRVAVLLWFGCVLTSWATEYVFEIKSYRLFVVNVGFWLFGMVLMGAIVGGWKKKAA
jgi:hypothetical protein